MGLPLQTAPEGPLAVAGTFVSFALFLSISAHIAARNVLGDVPVRNAFVVGPVPAAVAIVVTALDVNSFLGLAVALALDGAVIRSIYDQSTKLSAYITLIQFVVSVILGAIIFGILALATSAPG